jgi:hypothetical protein
MHFQNSGCSVARKATQARKTKIVNISGLVLMLPLIALFLTACDGGCLNEREIEKLLYSELQPGDNREKVESVLTANGIAFSYDRFQHRYQATLADQQCGPNRAISVYITLDDSMRLSEIRVFESFTMP